MIWQTSPLLLLVVIGGCHGNPTPDRMSRFQERAGGFMEFGDIPGRIRGVCKTVLNVESVLTTFPLSLVSGAVFSIPLPIPNPLILDPLRLYEFSIRIMGEFQNTVNGITGEGPQAKAKTSRKRDLSDLMRSYDIERVQVELDKIREKMNAAFKPFNFQERSSITEREAEDPGKPGYLLNLRNVLDIVEYACPLVDLTESFFKTSFLGFLRLYKIPLPIPDGTPINILKALDIWDIEGGISRLANSISSIFSGGATTTPAPVAGGLFGGLFGSPAKVTTPAPNFIQGALSSVGGLFGLFGGGSAPQNTPEIAASEVQHDEVMEIAEEPHLMTAVVNPSPIAPVKVSTVAPVKLDGVFLGINMDWLFGNDSAKPVILPTVSSAPNAVATTAASVITKVVSPTVATTKSPVVGLFDSLFGVDVTATNKPSAIGSPTTTTAATTKKAVTSTTTPLPAAIAATTTTPSIIGKVASPTVATTKSPVVGLLDSLFGVAVTATTTTMTSKPTTTTVSPAVAKAAIPPTTTNAPKVPNFFESIFG